MGKKKILLTIGLVLLIAMAAVLASLQNSSAGECKIIRIDKGKSAAGSLLSVDPGTLEISKGTCIVWINWVPAQQIKVMFEEDGKKCADATQSPVGFKLTQNCFVTDIIPLGGTSSLLFKEAGTFKYKVVIPGSQKGTSPVGASFGPVQGEGVIVVK
jgi:hypothetical protein